MHYLRTVNLYQLRDYHTPLFLAGACLYGGGVKKTELLALFGQLVAAAACSGHVGS